MILRKSTPNDHEGIYKLICQLEEKQLPVERFAQIYAAQITDSRYYALVCQLDGKIVGVLNLRFEEQLHHTDRIAEILEFSIDPEYRSQGIGKQMLDRACDIAEEFGCLQIELATNQLRTNAHRFYSREGMHNFHYKFSKPLGGITVSENKIGR